MASFRNTKMRVIRVGMNLTANEVAEKIGISKTFYCQSENGRLIPSENIQKKISEFYGLPFLVLVEEYIDNGTLATAISNM